MRRSLESIAVATVTAVFVASPAFAGLAPATPAPVVGLGVPALALFAVAYRRLRRRDDK